MTLGSHSERWNNILRTERLAYDRKSFPIYWNQHTVLIVKNYLYETDEGRLFVDLDLHCKHCEENKQVRGTVDSLSEAHRDALKLIPLGHFFINDCGEQ